MRVLKMTSLLLIYCLVVSSKTHAASDEVEPKQHGSHLADFLLRALLAKSNTSGNFLVAPSEISALINDLRASDKTAVIENAEGDANHNSEHQRGGANSTHMATTQQPAPPGAKRSFELINSVSLRARWAFNFQKRDTHKRLFYTTPHAHVYTNAMRKDDIFGHAVLTDLSASALELPLQKDNLKMLILLPQANDGLAALEQQLRHNLTGLIDEIALRHLRPTFVRVFMPIFKINHSVELSDVFAEAMNSTWWENPLNFGATPKVVQRTRISVAEDGIGELERTTVLFWNAFSSLRTTPVVFDIKHPFFFVIRNEGEIRFMGHLSRF